MKKLVRPPLRHILDAIAEIRRAIKGKTMEEYSEDWLLRRGVERGVEIISKASKRIPLALRKSRPEIPWSKIAGIGNVLRHEYHEIADDVIFEVATTDINPLEIAIRAIEAGLDEPID
jgi:uncharacterized protein with HEPN domain